ncbi:hypothetical protein JAB2_30110 [Janthinobacterium sp. HH100]|nr:hypothetical protein JAB2_30110 [Janthinobacterium sp. HH100]
MHQLGRFIAALCRDGAAQVACCHGFRHFHGVADGAGDRARDPPRKTDAHQHGQHAHGDQEDARAAVGFDDAGADAVGRLDLHVGEALHFGQIGHGDGRDFLVEHDLGACHVAVGLHLEGARARRHVIGAYLAHDLELLDHGRVEQGRDDVVLQLAGTLRIDFQVVLDLGAHDRIGDFERGDAAHAVEFNDLRPFGHHALVLDAGIDQAVSQVAGRLHAHEGGDGQGGKQQQYDSKADAKAAADVQVFHVIPNSLIVMIAAASRGGQAPRGAGDRGLRVPRDGCAARRAERGVGGETGGMPVRLTVAQQAASIALTQRNSFLRQF